MARPTLESVLRQYLRDKAVSEKTAKDYAGLLRLHWGPYLSLPVDALGPNEFLNGYRTIESDARANYSTRVIRALYGYYNAAMDDNLPIPTRKALAILGPRKVLPRDRLVSQVNQARWYEAVDATWPTASDLFKLLALTGLRQGEALGLTWSRVSIEQQTLTIDKTKNGKPHTIPLGRRLTQVLKVRNKFGGERVFPISERNVRFCVAMVVKECCTAWSCHDLRRGFATAAVRLQIPDRFVKRLMNHAEGDVTGRHYVWLDVEDLRPHIQAIEDYFTREWKPPVIPPAF